MEKIICGELLFEEKKYYFNFNNDILVIQPEKMLPTMNWFFERLANTESIFNDRVNVFGETNEGKHIVFINVKFAKLGRGCFHAFVPAYAIGDTNNINPLPTCDNIKKMNLYGTCLDKFNYPKKIVETSDLLKSNDLTIKIENLDNCIEKFISNRDVYSYKSSWTMLYGKEINNVLNVNTILTIDFNKIKNINEIIDYYLKIEKLFCFINNRNKVKFEKIILFKDSFISRKPIEDTTKKIDSTFELFITSSDETIDISNIECGVRLEDIKENYINLFKEVTKKDFIVEYYPPNSKEDSVVNNDKYTQISASFESEFTKLFPDFKSTINDNYKYVKDGILNYLKKQKSLNKKQKKYNKYFMDIVSKIDGTLEEKINYTLNRYDKIIKEKKDNLLRVYKIKEIKNGVLAESFVKRRNKIAHGKSTESFNDVEVIIYVILRICVYCLTLERCGFKQEKIKTLINKLF